MNLIFPGIPDMLEVNKYNAGKNSNLGRWVRRVRIQYNTIATSRASPAEIGKVRARPESPVKLRLYITFPPSAESAIEDR